MSLAHNSTCDLNFAHICSMRVVYNYVYGFSYIAGYGIRVCDFVLFVLVFGMGNSEMFGKL